jgi:hypothetical protein
LSGKEPVGAIGKHEKNRRNGGDRCGVFIFPKKVGEPSSIMSQCIQDIRPILNKDFEQSEVQRKELAYYEPLVQRGSFRLKFGLFRTESEQREYIDAGKKTRLPNVRFRNWPKLILRIRDLLWS